MATYNFSIDDSHTWSWAFGCFTWWTQLT